MLISFSIHIVKSGRNFLKPECQIPIFNVPAYNIVGAK